MARLLVVGSRRVLGFFSREVVVLRHFGFEPTVAVLNGTGATAFETPVGALNPTSDAARAFLRQFDVVLVIERSSHIGDGTASIEASLHWLRWSEPEDPIVVIFGTPFSTNRVGANAFLPSDFPLVRPNPSDLATTTYMLDSGATWSFPIRIGTRIRLVREDSSVYIATVNWRSAASESGFWKLNLANHNALGENGEVIAVPDLPDVSFPTDAVVAYRYRKHFLFPMLYLFSNITLVHFLPLLSNAHSFGVFWLVYALKLCGIKPFIQIPISLDMERALHLTDSRLDGLSHAQQLGIYEETYDWLAQFAQSRGFVVVNGVTVGGRDRARLSSPSFYDHWVVLNRSDLVGEDVQRRASRLHQLLLTYHNRSLASAPFDINIAGAGYNTTTGSIEFRRHEGGLYGAPNDIPIAHGIVINKRYAPLSLVGIEYELDNERYIELDAPRSGTAQNLTIVDGSYHVARMILENGIEEMKALGFPDGVGCNERYLPTGRNSSGGVGYWQAMYDVGYRAVRASIYASVGKQRSLIVPNRIWNDFYLIDSLFMGYGSTQQGSYGLYHPTSPLETHAVGALSLDIVGDIIGDFPNTAYKAYRRLMSRLISVWLGIASVFIRASFPAFVVLGASPTRPTVRFSEGLNNAAGFPAYNHVVELVYEMDKVIAVLEPFFKWGTVCDMIQTMRRVMV